MASIDRKSPIPIYHQLKTLVREQIEKGLWSPGDRIPTEHELCDLYDISRSPVRQALKELAYEGVLVRRPGLGTFVDGNAAEGSVSHTPIRVMSSDPHWFSVLDRAADVWNAEHPHLPITFQVDLVDHSLFYNLLSAAVGSGVAPDLAMVDGVWVAGLAQAGFLYALSDFVSDLEEEGRDLVQDLYPAFVEANSLDGKLYGFPLKADVSLLWYRRDWFAQEGLQPPRTWDDLIAVGRHFLQDSVRERYGLEYPLAFPGGVAGGEATVYNLMPFIWSAGGGIFDGQMDRVIFDSPATRRA
ncbi:MAG TPA: extracellular solute-binding protein, partial [Chloroflexi bacterium]|nr:extracellular solute-binding protein [Chloroflexota bacterium]